jgi:hypothetical protein
VTSSGHLSAVFPMPVALHTARAKPP